ncbi:hypothetical protein [Marasmitruncus massiliensis]|uniref:hypothetical protein n=1 Tax=Marasmitruncus massiliensis TaxID=1944642 RepID=UPI000C7C8A7D|nr:hypothetical protein [Marasmitruncus massiliensis]MBE6906808.1 hypothetical protein [Oscillospiraceae bacterium]
MLEKNSLIHPGRKKRSRQRKVDAAVDPHAEMTNAFINQAITSTEGYRNDFPRTEAGVVIPSTDWMRGKNR